MIFVTREKLRKIILAHAARIRSGELRWVKGQPREGECCVGFIGQGDGWNAKKPGLKPGPVSVFLAEGLSAAWYESGIQALQAEAKARTRNRRGYIQWNDTICRSPETAARFLEAAAKRLED